MGDVENMEIGVIHENDQHSPNIDHHQMYFQDGDNYRLNGEIYAQFDVYFLTASFNSIINKSLEEAQEALTDDPTIAIHVEDFIRRLRKYADQFEALIEK